MFKKLITLCASLSAVFGFAADNLKQLATDNNQFGLSLYSDLNEGDNILFSPYSIFACLSMVYEGARGDTAKAMSDAMHISLPKALLPLAANQLASMLSSSSKDSAKMFQLNIANALWLDEDTTLLSDYRHIIEDEYEAKVEVVDFTQTAQTVELINTWVSDQTQAKIPHLLQDGDVTSDTRLVLTNAIYFKGTWQKPFDPKATVPGSFYVQPQAAAEVQMMQQIDQFAYAENEKAQILSLPFVGKTAGTGETACLFILPKEATKLSDLEANLTAAVLSDWTSGLVPTKVRIKMPKFTLEQRFDLNRALTDLGMRLPLSDGADFSGIDGLRDLFISKVVHQAYFELDEAGVTAAAATAASMNTTTAQSEKPIAFIADHPFLFMVIERNTKTVLFMGKFQNPANP